jgi:ADP-heptose:LPS heptosyltransferase
MFPPDSTLSRKVVVLHQGALGDFLLTLPILEGLKRSNPSIRIHLWTKAEHVALLAEKTYFGQEPPPDDSELLPFFHDELWKEASIPRFFQNAGAILVFGQAGSRVLAARLSKRMPCTVQWVQSFPGSETSRHVYHFLLEQFRRLGWALEECLPGLKPSLVEISLVQDFLRENRVLSTGRPVLLHPGSGGIRKIWPLKNWWSLLEFFSGCGLRPVVMTLGPADEGLKSFAREVKRLEVLVLEGITLPRLAALISQCRLFVGSDSGVSHLAAVVGTPTVVVFGPSDPAIWAPRGPHVHIIKETWKESDVLDWSPDGGRVLLDSNLIELLRKCLQSL